MAITYLSGGRIQGRSDDVSASVTTLMDTLTFSGTTDFDAAIGEGWRNRGHLINTADSDLVGTKVKIVTVRVKQFESNALTGDLTCGIWDSTGAATADSFNTYNSNQLSTSETDVVFTNTNPTRVLESGDAIMLYFVGDSTHHVAFERSSSADAFDGTDSGRGYRQTNSGTFGASTDTDHIMKIEGYAKANKSTITDVPTGTRYEETNTRKIFRRKKDISATFDGTDENDWTDTFNDDVRGTKIQSGHTLIGKVITSITLKGRYASGTTGTYKLALFNATGVVQHLFKTGSISVLGNASSGAEFTGNDSVNSGTVSARTVSADYIIGVTNSGNGSNRVQLRQSTSIGRANEITGKCASAGSAFVEAGENADLYMNISYLYDDWVEKGTA